MAAEPQRLALGLTHHVQKTTECEQGELADRAGSRVHFRGKAAISIGVAVPFRASAAIQPGSSNSTASAVPRAGPRDSVHGRPLGTQKKRNQGALGRIEELEQRNGAGRQQGRRAPHRVAAGRLDLEHVGAEVGRDSPVGHVASLRQSGTPAFIHLDRW